MKSELIDRIIDSVDINEIIIKLGMNDVEILEKAVRKSMEDMDFTSILELVEMS